MLYLYYLLRTFLQKKKKKFNGSLKCLKDFFKVLSYLNTNFFCWQKHLLKYIKVLAMPTDVWCCTGHFPIRLESSPAHRLPSMSTLKFEIDKVIKDI